MDMEESITECGSEIFEASEVSDVDSMNSFIVDDGEWSENSYTEEDKDDDHDDDDEEEEYTDSSGEDDDTEPANHNNNNNNNNNDENDGIDLNNIVLGKRRRTQTDFYVDKDHASLLLADIDEDEYNAAVVDEDLSDDEESETEDEYSE